jgi:hypothetical protein
MKVGTVGKWYSGLLHGRAGIGWNGYSRLVVQAVPWVKMPHLSNSLFL